MAYSSQCLQCSAESDAMLEPSTHLERTENESSWFNIILILIFHYWLSKCVTGGFPRCRHSKVQEIISLLSKWLRILHAVVSCSCKHSIPPPPASQLRTVTSFVTTVVLSIKRVEGRELFTDIFYHQSQLSFFLLFFFLLQLHHSRLSTCRRNYHQTNQVQKVKNLILSK